jgi:hypothetical protein
MSAGRRGSAEVALDLGAQRSLLACADLALLGAARAREEPALWIEAAAHGAVPLVAGGADGAADEESGPGPLEQRLRAWLGPRRMTALLDAGRGTHDLAARARALLERAVDELPALACALRTAARDHCDWEVRARCLAQHASQRVGAARTRDRGAEVSARP